MENLKFLQDWYTSQCDGDWEHTYGITITTLDNPGWSITIDLENTGFEENYINENVDLSKNDWYSITNTNKQLIASCDSNKLNFMLEKIRNVLTKPTVGRDS